MSWLHRHVWALLAACVALAGGLALGAGPLQGREEQMTPVGGGSADDLTPPPDDDPFQEALTLATRQSLVDARLQGGFVTLVVLPEVDDRLVDEVTSVIEQAGGSLTATVRLDEEFVDPTSKTYVDSVAKSSAKGVEELAAIPSDDTYALISGLFTRAYVTGEASRPVVDEVATKIDSELQGAKLVTVEGDWTRRGSLVVVLAPDDVDGALATAAHLIEVKLIAALSDTADAVIVATSPAASSPGGLLEELSDAKLTASRVSTLNVVDSAAGQVASVFALAAAANGQVGDFGMVNDQVVLPPGLSIPRG